MKQLTIDLTPSVTSAYDRCVEYVAARVHQQNKKQKSIARDMDLAPSQLSQKLGPEENSSARFTLNDLENYISVTGDVEPVKYLVTKYLGRPSVEALEMQIAELQKQVEASKQ